MENNDLQSNSSQAVSKHAGYKVLAAILITASCIGVFAYYRFVKSEKHLTAQLHHFEEVGPNSTTQQCVDQVMSWTTECSAMLSLCIDSVPRMMGACLAGRDRSEMCAEIETIRRSTSFGFEDCSARDLDRPRKKSCASAYRAIDKHCEVKATR